jgi:hypothetical protein
VKHIKAVRSSHPEVSPKDLYFALAAFCLSGDVPAAKRSSEIASFESFQQRERAKDAVLADRASIAAESLAAGRAA